MIFLLFYYGIYLLYIYIYNCTPYLFINSPCLCKSPAGCSSSCSDSWSMSVAKASNCGACGYSLGSGLLWPSFAATVRTGGDSRAAAQLGIQARFIGPSNSTRVIPLLGRPKSGWELFKGGTVHHSKKSPRLYYPFAFGAKIMLNKYPVPQWALFREIIKRG